MLVRIFPALLFCASILSTQVMANDVLARESWVELGSAHVRVSENNVTIYPDIREKGEKGESFSKLRFHITHGDATLHQARVYLVKGDVFHINLQKSLTSNNNGDSWHNYSQMIPLIDSQQSPIKKVIVFYHFEPRQTPSKQVTLELLGIPVKQKN